jgi:hypothetical protein
MGLSADKSNIDYRLSFANQGKQTSLFHLQKTNGSLMFLFWVCRKQTEVVVFQ